MWFAVLLFVMPLVANQTSGAFAQADELYRGREDIASARQAADLYEKSAAQSFEAAWKLSRACYWLATGGPDRDRKAARERGVKAGELAVRLDASKPEGHFWREELELVLKMDAAWQQGSADRALGEWYFKVPSSMGGDRKKAEEHLRASLKYNEQSIASLFFLAEVTAKDDERQAEARPLLQQALNLPVDPEWVPEDKQFKTRATALLAELNRK